MTGDGEITRRAFVSGLAAGGLALAGADPALAADQLEPEEDVQARPTSLVVAAAPMASPRRGETTFAATLAEAKAAGVSTLVVPVFGIEQRAGALELLLRWRQMVAERTGAALIAERPADFEAGRRGGRVALVGHAHGLQWVDRDVELIEVGRASGIRAVKLSAGWRNLAADGAFEASDLGLTRLGRDVVAAVGKSGVVLDLAGAGRKSSLEAIERIGRPVIVSHAGAAVIHPHPGNLDDDRIRAIAAAGGVIGVTAFPAQLGDGVPSIAVWLRHLAHLVEVAGPEHVGLGLDFVDARPRRFPTDPWPDEPFRFPEGLARLSDVRRLPARLAAAGYSTATAAAILGGNFEWIFRAAFGPPGTGQSRND